MTKKERYKKLVELWNKGLPIYELADIVGIPENVILRYALSNKECCKRSPSGDPMYKKRR